MRIDDAMRAIIALAVYLISVAIPLRAHADEFAFPLNFPQFRSNDPLIQACGYDIERLCKGYGWGERDRIIKCLDADKARLTVECPESEMRPANRCGG